MKFNARKSLDFSIEKYIDCSWKYRLDFTYHMKEKKKIIF